MGWSIFCISGLRFAVVFSLALAHPTQYLIMPSELNTLQPAKDPEALNLSNSHIRQTTLHSFHASSTAPPHTHPTTPLIPPKPWIPTLIDHSPRPLHLPSTPRPSHPTPPIPKLPRHLELPRLLLPPPPFPFCIERRQGQPGLVVKYPQLIDGRAGNGCGGGSCTGVVRWWRRRTIGGIIFRRWWVCGVVGRLEESDYGFGFLGCGGGWRFGGAGLLGRE